MVFQKRNKTFADYVKEVFYGQRYVKRTIGKKQSERKKERERRAKREKQNDTIKASKKCKRPLNYRASLRGRDIDLSSGGVSYIFYMRHGRYNSNYR